MIREVKLIGNLKCKNVPIIYRERSLGGRLDTRAGWIVLGISNPGLRSRMIEFKSIGRWLNMIPRIRWKNFISFRRWFISKLAYIQCINPGSTITGRNLRRANNSTHALPPPLLFLTNHERGIFSHRTPAFNHTSVQWYLTLPTNIPLPLKSYAYASGTSEKWLQYSTPWILSPPSILSPPWILSPVFRPRKSDRIDGDLEFTKNH